MEHLTTTSMLGVPIDKERSFNVPTVYDTAVFVNQKRKEIRRSGVNTGDLPGTKVRNAAHIGFKRGVCAHLEAAFERWEETGSPSEVVFALEGRSVSQSRAVLPTPGTHNHTGTNAMPHEQALLGQL
mgnify:CR=1 FL=1